MLLAGTEHLNLTRYLEANTEGPWVESYWFRCIDWQQRRSLWYRCALIKEVGKEAMASLLLMLTDLGSGNELKLRLESQPLNQTRFEEDLFYCAVAGGELYHKGSHGNLAERTSPYSAAIEWELEWQPNNKAFYPLWISPLYKLNYFETKLVTPNPELQVSGTFKWGDEVLNLDKAFGYQAHWWGPHYPSSWSWGQVCHFEGYERCSFEAFSGSTLHESNRPSPFCAIRVVIAGEEYLFNQPWQWRRNHSRSSLDRWHVEAENRHARIVGDVFIPRTSFVGFTYSDARGGTRYVHHSESATLQLQLYQKQDKEWVMSKELRSLPSMAYEFVSSERIADIPIMVGE